MEGYGFPKTSGGLRSTAMVRLADRVKQLWDQVTSREGAYQPYKEEEEDGQARSRGEESARLPAYQGRRSSPGLQGKSEEVNLRVEAALQDSRTFLITLSCRSITSHFAIFPQLFHRQWGINCNERLILQVTHFLEF